MKRILVALAILAGIAVPAAQAEEAERPNIIFILTDDQNASDMRWMPKTQQILGTDGTEFVNSYVSLSLCCPARAAILSGQHAHNNGVWSNNATTGGYGRLDHANALPVWLQTAGYHTVHIGKYLHGTGMSIPPGWSDWRALVGAQTAMYGWSYNDNGTKRTVGKTEAWYQTDVHAQWAVDVIEETDGPFFMQLALSHPHVQGGGAPPLPPLRYRNTVTEPLPRNPNFNVPALLSSSQIRYLDTLYKRRAESLMAVDDAVETIWAALEATGKADNTVVVFTSDNGYLLGEHGRIAKVAHYEESMRVPLLVRGSGFPGGEVTAPVQNIDYAPTFAQIAGATPTHVVDGVPLMSAGEDRVLLMESSRPDFTTKAWWQGVYTGRWKYVEWANKTTRNLHDLDNDPWELVDLARNEKPETKAFRTAALVPLLAGLKTCAGPSCYVEAPGL